jgi:hypothetical protein
MSDNLRRYRAIRDALTQWYPGEPKGNMARHSIFSGPQALNSGDSRRRPHKLFHRSCPDRAK